ncbi:MAG TPA: hypothetical protein VJG83_06285 [archaeon]|nr:hypothetical protein [archaeon]
MSIYRFLVYSDESIHGVRLRKLVKKVADELTPPILGETQNLDDEHEVEVLCSVQDKAHLATFVAIIIKSAKEIADVDVKIAQPLEVNDLHKYKNFKDFKVIRGDALKEIELEIEGAERLFRKLQENFEKFILKRENNKLKGLDYLLKTIAGNLKPDEPKAKWHTARTAISDFVAEPFDDDLFQSVQEIDQLLYELADFEGQDISKLPKEQVEKLLRLIDISRKKIADLHRQEGSNIIIK